MTLYLYNLTFSQLLKHHFYVHWIPHYMYINNIYIYTYKTSLLGHHLPWSIIAVWCVWFIKFTIFAQSLYEKSPFTRIWNPDGIPLLRPMFSHRNGRKNSKVIGSMHLRETASGACEILGFSQDTHWKIAIFYRENDGKMIINHWNWEVYIYICGIWYWCTGIWLWFNTWYDMYVYIYTGIIGNNQNTYRRSNPQEDRTSRSH